MGLLKKFLPSQLFIRSKPSLAGGRGIAFRLSFLILVTTSLIFIGLFGYYYAFSRQLIEDKIEEDATHLAQATANRIDKVLGATEKIPEDLSVFMEYLTPETEGLSAVIKNLLENNDEIYGTAVAFEPYAYNRDMKCFAPYFYKDNGKIASTNISYEYFSWDWYQIPRELGRASWIEPYFDEGAGNILMSTYALPFYQGVGEERKLKGIVTVDISLSWLKEIVSSIKMGKTGYAFLISKTGTFVTHPNSDLIMNESIFGIAEARGDNSLREIGRDMIAGKSGFARSVDMISGVEGWMAYAPLSSSGWSLAVIFPESEVMADITRLNQRVIFLGIGGFLLLYFIIIWIARGITRPLRDLTEAAATIAGGNLDAVLPSIRTKDEVGRLASSFYTMKDSLKEHIRNLTATTAAKERIESELRLAHDIQMGILPRIFPPFPDRKEIDIFATLVPAKEVGGDLFDFFFMDDDHLCFSIGDVSGKGIAASLFMAVTKMLIKAKAVKGLTPETILARVNEDLSLDNPSMMFVTLFLGILDVASGEIVYCNGGHNPPYIIRADGEITQLEGTKGMALGVMEDLVYKSRNITMKKGDKIFLYTDGVTEAVNQQDELFSEKGLETGLSDLKNHALKELISGVMDRIETFAGGTPQADDITMLIIGLNK